MVTVYLSNKTILAAVGSGGSDRVSVRRLCRGTDEVGCIVGGIVTDAEEFKKLIAAFWAENGLPKKGVKLVVDSAQFISKVVDVPEMNEQKTREFVRMEFSSVDRASDPIYSWHILGKNKNSKMNKVFATMVERGFIKTYYELFDALDIVLDAITPATLDAVRILGGAPQLTAGTRLVQLMDEMSVTSVLFSEGTYVYSTKKRMFNEQNTAAYGGELAQTVSNMLQFVDAQHMEALQGVFFCGAEQLSACTASVEAIGLEAAGLDMDAVISLSCERPEGCEYVYAAGALLKSRGGAPILEQYEQGLKKPGEGKRLRGVLIAAACMVLIAGGLFGWKLMKENELRAVTAYNENPDNLTQAQEYDALSAELAQKQAAYGVCQTAEERLASYPTPDSSLNAVLYRCASGLAEIEIVSYEAESGILRFNATAAEVDLINRFIDLLRNEPSFNSVSYTGYAYREDAGLWQINVVCTLAEDAGRGN